MNICLFCSSVGPWGNHRLNPGVPRGNPGVPRGCFNNQNGSILVHIYNLVYLFTCQIWKYSDKNFRVKIKNMEKNRGPGGPLCQIQRNRATKISENTEFITVQTYSQQKLTINNQFFIYRPKCEYNKHVWLLGGGGAEWSDWAYYAFQLSSHPYTCIYIYIYTCEIRKQSVS